MNNEDLKALSFFADHLLRSLGFSFGYQHLKSFYEQLDYPQNAQEYLEASGCVFYPIQSSEDVVFPIFCVDRVQKCCFFVTERSEMMLGDSQPGDRLRSLTSLFFSKNIDIFSVSRSIDEAGCENLFYQHQDSPSFWFFSALKRSKRGLALAIIATILTNIFTFFLSFFSLAVYDRVIPNAAFSTLIVLFIGALVFLGADFFNRYFRSLLLQRVAHRLSLDLGLAVFNRVLRLSVSSSPGVMGGIVKEFDSVQSFFTAATLTMFGDLPFTALFMLGVGLLGGWVVIIPFFFFILILWTAWLVARFSRRLSRLSTIVAAEKTGFLFEALNGSGTLRIFNAVPWAVERWRSFLFKNLDYSQKIERIFAFFTAFLQASFQLNTLLLVLFGAVSVIDQNMSFGALFVCVLLSGRILSPVSAVAQLLLRKEQVYASMEALSQMMQAPTEHPVVCSAHVPDLHGDIVFRNVDLGYLGNSSSVLQNINLRIEQGKKLGILGRVGSGKSTLLRAIAGVILAGRGDIMMGGHNLSHISPDDLRRHISYISHEDALFKGTVAENLMLGLNPSGEYDLERVLSSSGMAQCGLFLEHPVDQQGRNLSSGQKQSLILARALISPRKVLLLDEPTTNMDADLETWVIHGLQKLMTEDRTFIVVTHRSSILSLVDHLLVLEGGKIFIEGSKDEVLKRLEGGKN